MTDIGFDMAHAAPVPRAPRRARGRRRGSLEYRAYHALVFGAVLPVATVAFAADALRGRPGASPVRRARRQAWAIAPMIFAP